MVSVPRQNSNSCDPTSAVFGGSTVLNRYYATYSGKKGFKFHVQSRTGTYSCTLKTQVIQSVPLVGICGYFYFIFLIVI